MVVTAPASLDPSASDRAALGPNAATSGSTGATGGGCSGATLGFPVKVRGARSGHEDSLCRRVQRGTGVSGVGCSGGDGGGDGGGGAIFQVPSGSTGLRRHREPSGSTTQLWPGALRPLGWLHLKK